MPPAIGDHVTVVARNLQRREITYSGQLAKIANGYIVVSTPEGARVVAKQQIRRIEPATAQHQETS